MKGRDRSPVLTALPAAVLIWALSHGTSYAEPADDCSRDWPQWRGPNRDGISPASHLIKEWPEGGPEEVWRQPLGEGYSGVSIAGARAYTMYVKGQDERVVCLDAVDGSEVWSQRTGAKFMDGSGNGPRSTPSVDGERVYVLGASGELAALEAATGHVIWQHNLRRKFRSQRPGWGFTSSPLVEDDLVLLEGGGLEGRALMAFDKGSGEVVWMTGSDPIGYSSPISVDVHATRQILFFTGAALVSVAPSSGQAYWRHAWPNRHGVNPATPVFVAPDGVFVSSGYGTGGALLQITSTADGLGVDEVWFSKRMKNHFSTSVYHEGHIYGFDDAILKCVSAETGAEAWKTRRYGKGTLILADGHLVVLGDSGRLALVRANPAGHVEASSAQVLSGTCWTSPSLAQGRLYLRNMEEILCLDVATRP